MGLLALGLVGELVAGLVIAHMIAGANPRPWPLSVAVVGDQYTAGIGNRLVWPTLMAQRTGWSVSNFALPDTGFIADGRGRHRFSYQVDRAQASRPQVIVIVGGIADARFDDVGQVRVGALDAINKVKISGKRVLVVGPTYFEKPVPDSVGRVSNSLRKATEEAGVPYLDALDPPWLTRDQMRNDLKGPNDTGQSAIADKVAAWLRYEFAR